MEAANYFVMPMMGLTAVALWSAAGASYARRRVVAGIREPVIWAVTGLVFAVFVLLKADRIAEFIEGIGRNQAKAGGMYGQRHMFQVMVIAGVVLVGALLWRWAAKHLAKRWRRYQWAFVGVGLIVCFAMIRMVSLHELDALGGTLMLAKGVVECAGCAMAMWAGLRRLKELQVPAERAREVGA